MCDPFETAPSGTMTELEFLREQVSELQKQLAAYEAEPVRGYEGVGSGRLYSYDQAIDQHLSADGSHALILKPADTKHLEAVIKQATEPLERKLAEQQAAIHTVLNTSISSTPEWDMSDNNGEIWSMFLSRVLGGHGAEELTRLLQEAEHRGEVKSEAAVNFWKTAFYEKREVTIKDAVDKFLCWNLPQDFHPDCGIHFDRENSERFRGWPIGTNLFTAVQAKAMFEHCLKEEKNETDMG